jgi:FKBP-type peptidyl-prolyl cis-trans isomerase
LFYVIENEGTGAAPTVCNNISVTYEGKLTNGNTFDKAESPVVFNLSQLITGFKNGIPLIKVGGRIRLYVPPSLGYGSSQTGSIPPNSVLVFTVNLVGLQ